MERRLKFYEMEEADGVEIQWLSESIPPSHINSSMLRNESKYWRDIFFNEPVKPFKHGLKGISCIEFSENGQFVVVGGVKGEIILWHLPTMIIIAKTNEYYNSNTNTPITKVCYILCLPLRACTREKTYEKHSSLYLRIINKC